MFCPASAVAGPVFVIETFVDAVTVVDAVAELFAAFRSNAVVETAAVFEREPVKVGLIVYVLVMTALAAETRVPRLQGNALTQAPLLETKVRPAGVASETNTAVASPGPPLVTVVVYTMFVPAVADAAPVLVMDRSAGGFPVIANRSPLEGEPGATKMAL